MVPPTTPTWTGNTYPCRPKIETLYDVFINICEDEKEHVGTMNACQIDGVTLGTANTINALTALALGGSAATRLRLDWRKIQTLSAA